MKRSELPNPTRFMRAAERVGNVWTYSGRPLHPVIRTELQPMCEPSPMQAVPVQYRRVTLLLHQSAFRPEYVREVGSRPGGPRTPTAELRVPAVSETMRYCTLAIPEGEYRTWPLCQYKLSKDGSVLEIQVVDDPTADDVESDQWRWYWREQYEANSNNEVAAGGRPGRT